jgi:hypothetical protein
MQDVTNNSYFKGDHHVEKTISDIAWFMLNAVASYAC